jgi:tetraacyldisaccharide 4'-kinase
MDNNETSSLPKKLRSYGRIKPVYRTFHHPFIYKAVKEEKNIFGNRIQGTLKYNSVSIKGRTVFAFSGLADNHSFQQTVKSLECNLSGFMGFPDHHPYSERDLHEILSAAKKSMSDCIITTEKDYVRIAHKIDWPDDLFVIGIEIDFGADKKRFNSYIKDWIKTSAIKA